jgi:putative nucleotidyltransferase with HDIG domain
LLVISYLSHRTSFGRIQDAQRHVAQVDALYMSTIEALAMAVDARDQVTHGHIRRVQVYAVELGRRLGIADQLQLQGLRAAALLHDMGKLAIPDHILNKPGKLTDAEFAEMKQHADIGADLLSSITFPYPVIPIVRHHHEQWNGKGYPAGLVGHEIPIGARILAVVDCFDALTSDRPYRGRLSDEQAFAIMLERRGTMYDPIVVDKFIEAYAEIAPLAVAAGREHRSVLERRAANTSRPSEDVQIVTVEALGDPVMS